MNNCPLCADFSSPTTQLLLRHIGKVHANTPEFHIQCKCAVTFTNFHAYKRHLRKKHREIYGNDGNREQVEHNGLDPESNMDTGNSGAESSDNAVPNAQSESLEKQIAMWILKLKEGRKLTQSATDEILSDVTELCSTVVSNLGNDLRQRLESASINPNDIPGFDAMFNEASPYANPFKNLKTQYLQQSFYQSNFNLVEPIQVTIGTELVWSGESPSRRVKEVSEKYTYVPILQVLESMLMCPSIFEETVKGHQRSDNIMEDFCDSPKAKNHPLLSTDTNAIQIMLYFDECELCNPLGSFRKKHKLGCYYYTIGNVHPSFRSTLNAIQLLCLVEAPLLEKYGHDKILQPAVDDIAQLEKGVILQTFEGQRKIFGTVVCVSGDNPGSSAIAGFKESSAAYRFCRQCMSTNNEFQYQFHESKFVLRSPDEHRSLVKLLQIPSLRDYYSVTFGINRDSILNSLDYFSVADETMPPDVMHDLLEGYLPYTTKLMLSYFFSNGICGIGDLNSIMANFDFGTESSSIPSPITTNHIHSTDKTRLGQTASQMWTLGRMLPVMIGHLIPEDNENWSHFLQLLDIIDHIFSPTVRPETPGYLEVVIEENLQDFVDIYEMSVLPKMHFLTHAARFLARMGPLVRYWSMRFEAKHQYFKSLATRMGNYINITYSLASRHQTYQCYILNSDTGYCSTKWTIGNGEHVKVHSSEFRVNLLYYMLEEDDLVFSPDTAVIHGMKLKPGVVVVTSVEDKTNPQFCQIRRLFIVNNKLRLGVSKLIVIDYLAHYHSWMVKKQDDQLQILDSKNVPSRQVLTLRTMRGSYSLNFLLTLKHAL